MRRSWRGVIGALAMLVVATACGDDTAADGPLFGDEVLDVLAARCESGDFVGCDLLYQASEVGSAHEALGDSCGGRGVPDQDFCVQAYGVTIDLEAARDDCAAGDMLACDVLYIYSPFGSAEEAFGDSCGSRGNGGRSCAVYHGWTP